MQHHFHPTILRAYDIRGIVGETLHDADAHAIGFGLGAIVRTSGGSRVAICRDGRLSSPQLAAALKDGLIAAGMSVLISAKVRRRCFILPTAILPVMPPFRLQARITRRHIMGSRWCLAKRRSSAKKYNISAA